MTTVILQAKAHHNYQLKSLEKQLNSTFEGLDFKITVGKTVPESWIEAKVSGSDQNVILNYLNSELGVELVDSDKVLANSVVRGYVTALGRSHADLCLSIASLSSEAGSVRIPVAILQAQLTDGRKVALSKIAELYGLHDGLPLFVRISFARGNSDAECSVSEKQLRIYGEWRNSFLDRLLILGASTFEVGSALRLSELDRDVVSVESLGFFEHALVCKLGTDARGLIPRVGKRFRDAGLSVFSPGKILAFLGE